LSLLTADTRDLISLLAKHRVRYLLCDATAVIYYEHVRTTGDVDIFDDRHPENARRLHDSLCECWGDHVPDLTSAAELTRPGLVLQFGVPPNRIDLINEIDGVSSGECWDGRCILSMPTSSGAVEVLLVGLRNLIRNKQASGRPRATDDPAFLRRLS
jgi:hypothetical protein